MHAVELRAPTARQRERCAGRRSRPRVFAGMSDQRTRSSAVAPRRDSPIDLYFGLTKTESRRRPGSTNRTMLSIARFLPRRCRLLFSTYRCNRIVATGRSGSVTRRGSRPHPRGDVSFFGSDGVRVDRGGGELRMPEPALQ